MGKGTGDAIKLEDKYCIAGRKPGQHFIQYWSFAISARSLLLENEFNASALKGGNLKMCFLFLR